jgi:hypothetical protein
MGMTGRSSVAVEARSRRLAYVEIEFGRCRHCGEHAAEHTVEGLCPRIGPIATDRPWPCFTGVQRRAFIDLDRVQI